MKFLIIVGMILASAVVVLFVLVGAGSTDVTSRRSGKP